MPSILCPNTIRMNCDNIHQQNKMKGKKHKKSQDSDQDDVSEASVQVDTDNSPRYIPVAKLGDKPKTKKIVINISDTQYPIVQQIAEELGWVIQKQPGAGDWDVWWTDRQIDSNTFFRMKLHQKINHFPGIYILARKNLFGLGLMAMKQYFPEEYNFFPQTWTVPSQFSQFRHYYQSVEKGKTRTYIVKPQALSQGRGIFLTRNIEDILNGNKYVIQRYLKNPMLIDKLKFDLRIYVLLAGTDPLRLYIFNEGLTRFATEEYHQPTNENIGCSYIHLTNYSLNKNNPKYIFNNSQKEMDKGHKRTLTSTYQKLAKNGINVEQLKLDIEDIIIKSVISGLPTIKHQYQYCQPEEYEGGMCFHILGFDVMLTDDAKPIIIQVNHTPSFQTQTPLDYLVKRNCIKDTLKLMRITQKNKRKNFQRAKQLAKIRLETGRRDIFKGKQREEIIKKARQVRDEAQKDIMGGFKKIFPPQDPQIEAKYNKFYEASVKISRSEADVRKKILSDQTKTDEKKEKSKICIKKVMSKEQKPSYIQQKQTKSMSASSDHKAYKDTSGYQNNFQTLHEAINQEKEEQSKLQHLQQNMIQANNSTLRNQINRNSFRTKINKKLPAGSHHQLIKYTDSIKKFNQLMVKFVTGKDIIPELTQSQHYQDSQAFQRLKYKINIKQGKPLKESKQGKSSSQGGYTHIPRDNKPLALTPGKGIHPAIIQSIQNGGIQCLKIQMKNGSFIKPKNYMLSDNRTMKVNKRWSGEEETTGNEVASGGMQHILGSLIVQNKSSKAYSKLLKQPVGRGIGIRR